VTKLIDYIRAFLSITLTCFSLTIYGQISDKNWTSECDTISEHRFTKLTRQNIRIMKKGMQITIPQMILLVRVYNTLQFSIYYQPDNKRKNKFRKLFDRKYSDQAVTLLECKPVQGNWYSEKYHLFITAGYHMRCDNYFVLQLR